MVSQFEKTVAIKRAQRRATRLISNLKLKGLTYYTERLKELESPTLKYRRFTSDLIQVYKIINDLKFGKFFAPTKSDITRNTE